MLRRHYFVALNGAALTAAEAWKVSRDTERVATFATEERATDFAIGLARADIAAGERSQVHLRHGGSLMTIWCVEDDQIIFREQVG